MTTKSFVIGLSQIKHSRNSAQKVLAELLNLGLDARAWEGTYGWDAIDLYQQDNRRIAHFDQRTMAHKTHWSRLRLPAYKNMIGPFATALVWCRSVNAVFNWQSDILNFS